MVQMGGFPRISLNRNVVHAELWGSTGEGQTLFASEILMSALQLSLGLHGEDKPRIGNRIILECWF